MLTIRLCDLKKPVFQGWDGAHIGWVVCSECLIISSRTGCLTATLRGIYTESGIVSGLVQACQALPSEAGQQVAWPVLLDMLDALVVLSADETLLIAALLFDLPMLRPMLPVLPWRSSTHQQMVGSLLDGQDAAEQVWTLHAGCAAGRNGEGLRRLLLALVHDLRVVPILLARQLAKMRAAGVLLESQRRALAQLTRDIHAPLANRLGIWQLKWELEDLAFCYLESEIYRSIASALMNPVLRVSVISV